MPIIQPRFIKDEERECVECASSCVRYCLRSGPDDECDWNYWCDRCLRDSDDEILYDFVPRCKHCKKPANVVLEIDANPSCDVCTRALFCNTCAKHVRNRIKAKKKRKFVNMHLYELEELMDFCNTVFMCNLRGGNC